MDTGITYIWVQILDENLSSQLRRIWAWPVLISSFLILTLIYSYGLWIGKEESSRFEENQLVVLSPNSADI